MNRTNEEIIKVIKMLRNTGWKNEGLTEKQSLEYDAADIIEELLLETDNNFDENENEDEDANEW